MGLLPAARSAKAQGPSAIPSAVRHRWQGKGSSGSTRERRTRLPRTPNPAPSPQGRYPPQRSGTSSARWGCLAGVTAVDRDHPPSVLEPSRDDLLGLARARVHDAPVGTLVHPSAHGLRIVRLPSYTELVGTRHGVRVLRRHEHLGPATDDFAVCWWPPVTDGESGRRSCRRWAR